MWFNGVSLVASDESYAQSNTITEWDAVLASIPALGLTTVVVKSIWKEGNSQSVLSAAQIDMVGQGYTTTGCAITPNGTIEVDGLTSFVTSETVVSGSAIKYQLEVGGVLKYWNGAAWATSNGTYAQANTAADINTNCASLSLTTGYSFRPQAVLSSGGTQQATLNSITVSYNFFELPPVNVDRCIVWSFIEDMLGEIATSATLTVELKTSIESGNLFLLKGKKIETYDTRGYLELNLIVGATYSFLITYTDLSGKRRKAYLLDAVIPDVDEISLTELTSLL
jgi:hypothetical protein